MIAPQASTAVESGFRRACRVAEDESGVVEELWWEYPDAVPRPDDSDCDSYLLAALLTAMRRHAGIRVCGSISRELLANLVEFQKFWVKWRPGLYHEVPIEVETIRVDPAPIAKAMVAFSGGVDAQFTAYRHARGLAGHARRPVVAGVFVHGFDIPLAEAEGFASAARNAREVLSDIGLELLAVKTNIREACDVNWEHFCGSALGATFAGMKKYAGMALIGSGDSYDSLITPWGSHPISDPLMSSGSLRILHDGAGFDRSEKIRLISAWRKGSENLRVCWAGGVHDRNCGKCEKCVRTRLYFLLAGLAQPPCFDGPLQPDDFDFSLPPLEVAHEEWKAFRDAIIRTGIGVALLPALERALRRPAARWERLLPTGSRRRALARRIVGKT